MKDVTISISLPMKDALRVIDFLTGTPGVASAAVTTATAAPVAAPAAPAMPTATPAPAAPAQSTPAAATFTPTPLHDSAGNLLAYLDITGAPWNKEVHADDGALDKEGRWKGRAGRGMKEKRVAVEAADKARLGIGAPATAAPAAPAFPQPAPAPVAPVQSVAPVAAPVTPAMPAAFPTGFPAFPAAPAMPAPVTYDEVVAKYGELGAQGKCTAEKFGEICVKIGCTNPAELTTNETLRAALMAEFNALG